MDSQLTADLWDAFETRCSSCEIQFKQYGARHVFSGSIRTVRCFNDNLLLRRMLETPSDEEVLVVDGGGSLVSALIGDVIALLGFNNGWSGVIIFGAVRDVHRLVTVDFGVKAIGTNPRKSGKHGVGEVDVPLVLGGATFIPGHWVYSDEDGILVCPEKLEEIVPKSKGES